MLFVSKAAIKNTCVASVFFHFRWPIDHCIMFYGIGDVIHRFLKAFCSRSDRHCQPIPSDIKSIKRVEIYKYFPIYWNTKITSSNNFKGITSVFSIIYDKLKGITSGIFRSFSSSSRKPRNMPRLIPSIICTSNFCFSFSFFLPSSKNYDVIAKLSFWVIPWMRWNYHTIPSGNECAMLTWRLVLMNSYYAVVNLKQSEFSFSSIHIAFIQGQMF